MINQLIERERPYKNGAFGFCERQHGDLYSPQCCTRLSGSPYGPNPLFPFQHPEYSHWNCMDNLRNVLKLLLNS